MGSVQKIYFDILCHNDAVSQFSYLIF